MSEQLKVEWIQNDLQSGQLDTADRIKNQSENEPTTPFTPGGPPSAMYK